MVSQLQLTATAWGNLPVQEPVGAAHRAPLWTGNRARRHWRSREISAGEGCWARPAKAVTGITADERTERGRLPLVSWAQITCSPSSIWQVLFHNFGRNSLYYLYLIPIVLLLPTTFTYSIQTFFLSSHKPPSPEKTGCSSIERRTSTHWLRSTWTGTRKYLMTNQIFHLKAKLKLWKLIPAENLVTNYRGHLVMEEGGRGRYAQITGHNCCTHTLQSDC